MIDRFRVVGVVFVAAFAAVVLSGCAVYYKNVCREQCRDLPGNYCTKWQSTRVPSEEYCNAEHAPYKPEENQRVEFRFEEEGSRCFVRMCTDGEDFCSADNINIKHNLKDSKIDYRYDEERERCCVNLCGRQKNYIIGTFKVPQQE